MNIFGCGSHERELIYPFLNNGKYTAKANFLFFYTRLCSFSEIWVFILFTTKIDQNRAVFKRMRNIMPEAK